MRARRMRWGWVVRLDPGEQIVAGLAERAGDRACGTRVITDGSVLALTSRPDLGFHPLEP